MTNLAHRAISQRDGASKHLLKLAAEARPADNTGAPKTQADASWENLPVEQLATAKANVDFYLDDFISVVLGGSMERRQMLRHLFHQIDQVFCPNNEVESNCKDLISLKNLGQGDGAWSTRKTFIR